MKLYRRQGLLWLVVTILCIPSIVEAAPKVNARVQDGSRVKLNYYFEADGKPVVTKDKKEGMEIVIGRRMMPEVFETQLYGLSAGGKKTIALRPDEAFGPYNPALVRRVAKAELPPNFSVKEGGMIASKSGARPMRVAKVLDDSIVLDQNHPLAGKSLVYHVQIEQVSSA